MFMVCKSHETKQAKKRLSVCLSVWLGLAVDTITFERVSGSKKNLVGVFYVWNVGLVLNHLNVHLNT